MVLRLRLLEVLIDRVAHGGIELLRAEAVASADDLDVLHALFEERGADVEVEGFAQGAGFLGAVEHGDLLAACGDGRHKLVRNEGAVQADLDEADLVALFVHAVDGLFHRVGAAAHDDGDVFRIGSAAVIEQMVAAAGQLVHLFHHLFDDGRGGVVVLVGRLAVLEVGIAVLRGALLDGVFGVEGAALEVLDVLHVDERLHFVIVDDVDLRDLVRGAEAVKEVQERHLCLQRGQVRDEREVHDLLNRAGSEHRKAGLAAGHYVLMVAEDVQRMSGDRARADVENGREQLAGDLVHVGDHEQEALARRVCRGERTGRQRAVHGTGGAALTLHLREAQLLAEHVDAPGRRPFVRNLCHRRGGGDGIDGRDFREGIRDVAGGGIAVDRHLLHRKI